MNHPWKPIDVQPKDGGLIDDFYRGCNQFMALYGEVGFIETGMYPEINVMIGACTRHIKSSKEPI